MRLPNILAVCEDCQLEGNCHLLENIAWSAKQDKWLCDECWGEYQEYDEEHDKYVEKRPVVFAKDALPDKEEQLRHMIATATARRMGV